MPWRPPWATILRAMIRLAPLIVLLCVACAAPQRAPTEPPAEAGADAAWERPLRQAEAALAAGTRNPAELGALADALRGRRDAAFRGDAPSLSPRNVRRSARLIAALERTRRDTPQGGPPGVVGPFRFEWPLAKARLTSEFGMRTDPFHAARVGATRMGFHNGVDLAAPEGSPVLAAAPGVVRFAGARSDGCGLTVVVDHPGEVRSEYCHLSQVTVRRGQGVQAGQAIGLVGTTGRSTGAHLHWIVRHRGKLMNPRHVIGKTIDQL